MFVFISYLTSFFFNNIALQPILNLTTDTFGKYFINYATANWLLTLNYALNKYFIISLKYSIITFFLNIGVYIYTSDYVTGVHRNSSALIEYYVYDFSLERSKNNIK